MDSLGIIGGGAMGSALLGGVIKAGLLQPGQITIVETDQSKARQLQATYGISITTDLAALSACQAIILAVKPQVIGGVLTNLAPVVSAANLIISIAAGINLDYLESNLPTAKLVRVMPNTPARIGQGVSAYTPGKRLTPDDLQTVEAILGCVGKTLQVAEYQMDAVTALSGSGPAYVYKLIEAMIDAGVFLGLPRDQASLLAVETLAGTAELLRQTGEHPAKLRNEVTSPGGTTAAGLYELEQAAFAAGIHKAILAAAQRSKELGKKN